MSGPRIPLARPTLGEEELAAVASVLQSGWLVAGPRVLAFEAALAAKVGVAQAIAVSSGTAALHLAALALNLRPGDEVLVPAFTFPATASAVLLAGGTPVLVDVDPRTFNLDLDAARRALGPRTRALVGVHEFGLPMDADVLALCDDAGLVLVEDAACALGAEVQTPAGWRAAGALGQVGCFSFHPRKVVTTGEGGALCTNDAALAERLRRLRSHGLAFGPGGPTLDEPGLNYRMSDINAALGAVQLGRLDSLLADRARIAALYDEALAPLPLGLPARPAGLRPSFQSYVVRLPPGVDRDAVIAALRTEGVESARGAYALHRLGAFSAARQSPGGLRGAEQADDTSLALPVPDGLDPSAVARVRDALATALRVEKTVRPT